MKEVIERADRAEAELERVKVAFVGMREAISRAVDRDVPKLPGFDEREQDIYEIGVRRGLVIAENIVAKCAKEAGL